MSAHPTPHSSEDSGSFWSVANIILAVLIGGFALFWGVALFTSAVGRSAGWIQDAKVAATAAPAAAAAPAASAAPATAAPAPAPVAGLTEITIKPDVSNPFGYNTKEFKVTAGQKVKLTFDNSGSAVPQPHNLCVGTPGSKDKLLAAAMQMATAPDGMAKGFIPDSPDVLYHTKLLQPGSKETIEFTAPAKGDYPYVCTFPGHGLIMNGVMKSQ